MAVSVPASTPTIRIFLDASSDECICCCNADMPARYVSSQAHPIPRPKTTFNLWEGEEERNYPAPSPGCRVLSPFPRHSRAILCLVPNRNCSLLYTPANFLHRPAQPTPPLHRSTRAAAPRPPLSPRPSLRLTCATKTKQIGNVYSIEQNSFLSPFTISYEWNPRHSPSGENI
jgi:hypothetical protein